MINLMLGDCLERMKEIESGSVDMILTDPPYGTTACKWDSIIPLEPMWEQLKRIIKPNGAIVLFGAEPFSSALRMSNIKNYKYDWIWEKNTITGHTLAKVRPLLNVENISVFGCFSMMPQKFNGTYNKIGAIKIGAKKYKNKKPIDCTYTSRKANKTTESFTNYPKRILKYNNEKGLHPTQKPVALMEYLIKTYTNESETVLDFTAGSFTTGVACANLNRKFIGIEMDKGYFDIGVNRIKERIRCLDLKIEPTISMGD